MTKIKSGKQHYSIFLLIPYSSVCVPLLLYPHMVLAVSHSLKKTEVSG